MRGNVGKSLYCGFHRKNMGEAGKQAQDGLVGVISACSGSQGLALVVWSSGKWP